MSGYELYIAREIDSRFRLQHPHHRERHGHECWLCVFRKGELLRRSLPNGLGQTLIEGCVNLGKHLMCRRKSIGQRLPHADTLTALTRKYESDGHDSTTEHTCRARGAHSVLARRPLLERHGRQVTD